MSWEEKKALVLEAYSSGLQLRIWCREHSISEWQFFSWRKQLLNEGKVSLEEVLTNKSKLSLPRKKHSELPSSDEERKALVLSAYSSELSIRDWAKEHDINRNTVTAVKADLIKNGIISADEIAELLASKRKKQSAPSVVPMFCELPIPKETQESTVVERPNNSAAPTPVEPQEADPMLTLIKKEKPHTLKQGSVLHIGEFSLSVEEDVSIDRLISILKVLGNVA